MGNDKKRFAPCHPDRPHYAKSLCQSCYQILFRDPESKRQADLAYEARNKTERNKQRQILAAKRRKSIADAKSNNHTQENSG